MVVCNTVVGVGHQTGAIRGVLPDGGGHEDCARGTATADGARQLTAHGATHQDLHERGTRQTALLRPGDSHSGEDETLLGLHTARTTVLSVDIKK